MAKGIEMHEAHFPGRSQIDAYGNGGFRFADMSHKGSILCIPSGIYGIELQSPVPTLADIEKIIEEAADIEILLIGTGTGLLPIPRDVKAALQAKNISSDPMSTGAAIRTYNVLLAENRAVSALLYAVD